MIIKSHEIPKIIKGHWSTRGLIGFWPMLPYEVGGNKVFDLSGNVNVGTFQGTAPSWTSGKFGSVVFLPGTDEYINIDSVVNDVAVATQGTITCWVKVADATPAPTHNLISFGDTDNISLLRVFINYQGKLQANCVVTGRGNMWDLRSDNAVFADNIWAFAAIVHNGTEVSLYFNGNLIGATFLTSTDKDVWFSALTGCDNARIGCYNVNSGGNTEFMAGHVDVPTIYNRALSASEIIQLYREPVIMFERDPIELWVGSTSIEEPPVGAAGIMTTNTGFWGPTF